MNQPAPKPVFLGFPSDSPAGRSITAGREIRPDFPREWFEFVHPEDPNHIFSIDLTWLESTWSCRFGTPECKGIDETRPALGCCIHGAYIADEEDRDTVFAAVKAMDPQFWQLRPAETDAFFAADDPTWLEPWLEWVEEDTEALDPDEDEGPHIKTKVVDGACIFANRPGHPTGPGCALHQWAMAEGRDIVGSKPEVCWQVPFSREDAWEERTDGQEILRTTIGEYHRRQWGGGGEDFDWWCTAAPACHTGATPVWQSMKDELIGLIGEEPYGVVAKHCEKRMQLDDDLRATHPATRAARGR
ncbi:hypothetical protein [Corynebacterium jeddahense]|uniref:DUF3109 family protein n=1 Tax=Corynebacterium jeddahense TaxID=1414719 RepID=A0ABY7UK30_9CORY|nr:hypothetical protein [Corynebacterium jeddahense]WCZ37908.1 hypothetical protein CJEDD_01405 [Corynebacterium jeddahense]